ncbi:hypothetical protein TNCV_1604171 [Trichonephila clavipes]|nr:hypothetical protein TNCV_1604171 [Trichonephila clavipes]
MICKAFVGEALDDGPRNFELRSSEEDDTRASILFSKLRHHVIGGTLRSPALTYSCSYYTSRLQWHQDCIPRHAGHEHVTITTRVSCPLRFGNNIMVNSNPSHADYRNNTEVRSHSRQLMNPEVCHQ